MFTGLIETVGRIVEVRPGHGGRRIAVASKLPIDSLVLGESVAVDGACLTVADLRGDRFWADVVEETCSKTTLGQTRTGQAVNLERSMRVGDRLGGHLVQGHVDATVVVERVTRRGGDYRLRVAMVPEIRRYVAMKGSITLAGVSLTVAGLDDSGLEVALIPTTLAETTLGRLVRGDRVNVEVDLVARYLDRLISEKTVR